MHPGERLAGFVKVVAGPWQYLVFIFLAAAVGLELTGELVPEWLRRYSRCSV